MLHGDRDPLVPVQNVDWLKNQFALAGKSKLFASIVLPGVNHFIPWEHPDEVAKAIGMVNDMTAGR
jgi:pimeloyl-ACP methyl ester carboxylesterase